MKSRLGLFTLFLFATSLSAAEPVSPLRHMPKENVTLLLTSDRPRELLETVTKHGVFRDAMKLPQFGEFFESTGYQRFYQLLAHVEKKLGAKWPELVDQIAGNGIAFGVDTRTDPGPALLVLQGTDAKKVAAAWEMAWNLIEEEVSRDAPVPVKATRKKLDNGERIQFGDDLHAARLGATILVTNKVKVMDAALVLKEADSLAKTPNVIAAKKAVGEKPLAWLWFDLARIKDTKASKDFFAATRKDFLQTMVVGSTIDAVRRADYLAARLDLSEKGAKLQLRLPAKRADLPPEYALHVPMTKDTPGSLPLIQIPNMLYSQSFYLDLGTLWKDRKKLLNDEVLAGFEKGVKDISKIMPGTSLDKLFETIGTHHRFVAIERGANLYKIVPDNPLPEMALISSTKDKKFGPSLEGVLRTAAVFISLNSPMELKEETYEDVKIASYYFSEKHKMADDPTNIRFNFAPSFATVGDYFVFAGSPGIVRDLVKALKNPAKSEDASPAVWRGKLFGSGADSGLRARPEVLMKDSILNRGSGVKQAEDEMLALAKWLGKLGDIGLSLDHEKEFFSVTLEWKK